MLNKTQDLLDSILAAVAGQDEKLGLRVAGYVGQQDEIFRERANRFFGRYEGFLQAQEGISIEADTVNFVLMHASVEEGRKRFLATGAYANTSFEEVNRNFYSNPQVMRQHMHGLVFAQFLWPDQYRRFQFFCDHLPNYAATIGRYLEVGGGHALYLAEAARQLEGRSRIEVVDISPTSLAMAKGILPQVDMTCYEMDIFDFADEPVYDFITMGEVLEHVEDPHALLRKLHSCLRPEGRVYLTTPANSPMPDHIYLFRNADEIRQLVADCGFMVELEAAQYAVSVPKELAERMKLPLMYAAFLRKS